MFLLIFPMWTVNEKTRSHAVLLSPRPNLPSPQRINRAFGVLPPQHTFSYHPIAIRTYQSGCRSWGTEDPTQKLPPWLVLLFALRLAFQQSSSAFCGKRSVLLSASVSSAFLPRSRGAPWGEVLTSHLCC